MSVTHSYIYKRSTFFGLIILFVFIALYLFKYDTSINPFILGDWLINYQDGGFKRRGLSGSFLFTVQDFTGISLVYLVYGMQLFLYALFFICFYKLLYKRHVSFEYFVLIFSPLTFLFFCNDTIALGRKEIMLMALFSLNALWHSKNQYTSSKHLFTSVLLFVFSLWHELIVFFVPYFVILHLFHFKQSGQFFLAKVSIYLAYLIPIFMAVFLIHYFGSEIDNGRSVEILHRRGVKIDGGIFTWNINVQEYILKNLNKYALYLFPFLYGYILFFFYIHRHHNYKLLIWLLIAFAFSVPLFILAIDWGRWIAIHFILTLILLGSKLKSHGQSDLNKHSSNRRIVKDLYIFFLIINFSFSMPHYGRGLSINPNYSRLKKAIVEIYELLPHSRVEI